MNYRKIYESAKLDEELLQEFNFKKAAAVGLMGLGLASGAFAKSNKSHQQKSKVISQTIKCSTGCQVSEKAEYTVEL